MTLTDRWAALLLVSLSIVAGGCLGEVAPKRVVAGTTLTFAFASSSAPVLYGADPNQNPATVLIPDRQRGNADFVLCANPEPNCGTPLPLSLRYITRVTPDRGSKVGRTGTFDGLAFPITGQDLVVLDVPLDTPPGNYQVAYVYRRAGATTDTRVTVQPITVVRGTVPGTTTPFTDSAFTDIEKALNFGGFNLKTSLQQLVPDPQLLLSLVDGADADRPAAGTIVLRYPSTVSIEGAFESGVLGQGSLVRVSPVPNTDAVSILFVDPDKKTIELRVPFTLNSTATAPVTADQFMIEAPQRLYKSDGSLLPTTSDPNAVGNSFQIFTIL